VSGSETNNAWISTSTPSHVSVVVCCKPCVVCLGQLTLATSLVGRWCVTRAAFALLLLTDDILVQSVVLQETLTSFGTLLT